MSQHPTATAKMVASPAPNVVSIPRKPAPGDSDFSHPAVISVQDREAFGAQAGNLENYGFKCLDSMAAQFRAMAVKRNIEPSRAAWKLSHKFGRAKVVHGIRFPTNGSVVEFSCKVDPCFFKNSPMREKKFLYGDNHNQSDGPEAMDTICVRLSIDSGMIPPLSSPTHYQDVAKQDVFRVYSTPKGRPLKHHNLYEWHIIDDNQRAMQWLNLQAPSVLIVAREALASACNGAAPGDEQFAVLLHAEAERLDVYCWSPSKLQQAAVCFEPWYGKEDGWGAKGLTRFEKSAAAPP